MTRRPGPGCPPELTAELLKRVNAALAEVGEREVTSAAAELALPGDDNACWVWDRPTPEQVPVWFRAAQIARKSLGLPLWDDLEHFTDRRA